MSDETIEELEKQLAELEKEDNVDPKLVKKIVKELFDDKVNQYKQNKCEQLKEEYGLTESFDCAGFITPKGEMISLCVDGKTEHDDMVPNHEKLISHMKDCCVVRFRKQDKRIWVESECRPTSEQVAKIVEAVRDCNIFYAYGPNECLLGLSNPRPMDVQRWISKCWRAF